MSEQNAFPGDNTHVEPENKKPADQFDQPKEKQIFLKIVVYLLFGLGAVALIGLFWQGVSIDEKKDPLKTTEVTDSSKYQKAIDFMAPEKVGEREVLCWLKYIDEEKNINVCLPVTTQNTINLNAEPEVPEIETSPIEE